MNLELIADNIRYFNQEIIESGFKRDIDDYLSSIASHQNNIITLREIASKVLAVLDHIYQSDLPDALASILPTRNNRPFTETPHYTTLKESLENTQIQLPEFFSNLSTCLTKLQTQIAENIAALNTIQIFIQPYILEDVEQISSENIATISIVFKEHKTITSLTQFTKTLTAWNRTLPIYHQLLKSESPEDIQIVEVQNGSIDFIVNLNVDVALDLVKLFKLGFEVFAAYLSYKHMVKPIIDSYHGNEKLISQEEEREKLLLENIGSAIQREIMAQHKAAKSADKKVDGTAIPKKVEQITNLITSHIVKGNDIKLIALPETREQEEGQEVLPDERESLRKSSMEARRQLRIIPAEAQQKLLEVYGKIAEVQE